MIIQELDMLLLSIRPEFVHKIFRGEKQVELRRRRPRSNPGDWIAVYSTIPEKQLVGIVQVEEVRVKSPECLWRSVREIAGLKRSDYLGYFCGADQAVGIMIGNPTLLTKPVTLDELRTTWPGFHPPQSFRYLTQEQVQFVVDRLGGTRRQQIAA